MDDIHSLQLALEAERHAHRKDNEYLIAERDNNHKLYADAIRERDEWKERHHELEAALRRLKGNVWAWEVPDDVREQVDKALGDI